MSRCIARQRASFVTASFAAWTTKKQPVTPVSPISIRFTTMPKGGQSFHFHALRHFAASRMIENGWPLPDVSAQLGHANVNITMQVYAHSIEKRAQSLEAMDALADRLTGAEIVPVAPSQHAKHLRIGNASSVISL